MKNPLEIPDSNWRNDFPLLGSITRPEINMPNEKYFDTLAGRISQTICNEDWHLHLAAAKPELKSPGDIYFSQFTQHVMKRLPSREDDTIIPFYKRVLKFTAVAACLAGSIWFFRFPVNEMLQNSEHASHSYEECLHELHQNAFMFDSEELAAFISHNGKSNVAPEFSAQEMELNSQLNVDELEALVE